MTDDPEQLIAAARTGGEAGLGALLELYRNYLRLLARIEIGRRLQGKLDASDVVQETFLEAHRHFPQFQGATEPQFVRWLRQILAAKVSNLVRHYAGTQGRDIRREQGLDADLERSSLHLGKMLTGSLTSPSQQAAKREEAVLVADALERLPEDYREVILLRHWDSLTFADIARRMNRTKDSVEKLWLRALTRLRQLIGEPV
jgi:RNA polymerase sigma-70 factor (ECF subfamily)